jgi:hypothetical protein
VVVVLEAKAEDKAMVDEDEAIKQVMVMEEAIKQAMVMEEAANQQSMGEEAQMAIPPSVLSWKILSLFKKWQMASALC